VHLSFSVTKEKAGSYDVVVDGLSGGFTVTAPLPAPVPTPKEVELKYDDGETRDFFALAAQYVT